jgi:hypothetical protein
MNGKELSSQKFEKNTSQSNIAITVAKKEKDRSHGKISK